MSASKRQMTLEAARRRRRGGVDMQPPVAWQDLAKMAEGIRPKRAEGSIRSHTEKLYVPVTPKVKVEFMRLARELAVSQAELGLVLVEAALADAAWFEAAVAALLKRVGPRVGWLRPGSPDMMPAGRKGKRE